jgi:hypothetical protein
MLLVALLPRGLAQTSRPLRERVPSADPKNYGAVKEGKDWRNPYLIVCANGIEVLGVTNTESPITVDSVAPLLDGLPDSAWPYGLIAAVQDNGILSSERDRPLIEANRTQLIRLLNKLGIAIELWPSA